MLEKTNLSDVVLGITDRSRQAVAALGVLFLVFTVSSIGWYVLHPSGFTRITDVIGYPIFANYNNYRPFYSYVVGMGTAVLILLVIVRLHSVSYWKYLPIHNWMHLAYACILGTMVSMIAKPIQIGVIEAAIATYLLLTGIRAILVLARPFADDIDGVRFALTSMMLLLLPLMTHLIARNTGWNDSVGFVRLDWFPMPLVIGFSLIAAAWLVWQYQRKLGNHDVERLTASWVLLPLLMFVVLANVGGSHNTGDDFFHLGEMIAPLSLYLNEGALPWRDFLFVHGVWDDFLKFTIGIHLWEPSLRAALVSQTLLIMPIYWVSVYLMLLVVLRGNVAAALLGTVLGFVLFSDPFRFPFYPFIIMLLFCWFDTTRLVWAIAFAFLTSLQVFISPEFGLLSIALGAGVILRDLLDKRGSLLHRFRGTMVCALTSALAVALVMLGLYVAGMLDGFLVTILHFSREHVVTGGIPIQSVPHLLALIGLLLGFILLTFWLVGSEFHANRQLSPLLLISLCLAGSTSIYFFKYFGRPDGHIYMVVAVSILGFVIVAARTIECALDRITTFTNYLFWSRATVSLLLYLTIFSAVAIWGLPGLPSENRASQWWQSFTNPRGHLVGSIDSLIGGDFWAQGIKTPGSGDRVKMIQDYLAKRLTAEEPVFDFSDSPLLSSAILGLKPASRFIHVSMAIRAETQKLLIDELRESSPRYVIYSAQGGLNGWDGISSDIRHHLVAAYINRNYVFDAKVAGVIFFRRSDLDPIDTSGPIQQQKEGVPAELLTCNLGFIPNFYQVDSGLNAKNWSNASLIESTNIELVKVRGWAASEHGKGPANLAVVRADQVLHSIAPNRVREDVDKAYGRQFGQIGFVAEFLTPVSSNSEDILQVFVENLATGKLTQFGQDGWLGHVDNMSTSKIVNFFNLLGKPAHYLKIDFESEASKSDEHVSIFGDDPKLGKIQFIKRFNHDSIILPLGGCYPWHELNAGQLYLSKPGAGVKSIQFLDDPRIVQ